MLKIPIACVALALGSAAAVACSPAQAPSSESPPAALAPVPSPRPTESLIPILERKLPNDQGEEFTSAVVEFPPAARALPHQHGDAFVYAYVLKGTVRSRLAGEPVRTYRAGESWVERPGAHHVLTENTSSARPARLLVVFISHVGDPLKTPLRVGHVHEDERDDPAETRR